MRSYLKETLDEMELVFAPNQFADYYHELPDKKRRNPYRNFKDSVFGCGDIWFWTGEEEDSISLTDFIGASEDLLGAKLDLDYVCIKETLGKENYKETLKKYIEDEAYNFLLNIEIKLNKLQTNFKVNSFFKQQLDQLYDSIIELKFLNQDESLDDVQKDLIDLYINSYEATESILKDLYGYNFAEFFKNGLDQDTEGGIKEVKDNGVANNGLLLTPSYMVTPRFAQRLKGWLMESEFIEKGTRSDSLQNIFQTSPEPLNTKIVWTGANKDLKYFIKSLYDNGIIAESQYQSKWRDVVNSFKKPDGKSFETSHFSKNSDVPTENNRTTLDHIVFKFSRDLTG